MCRGSRQGLHGRVVIVSGGASGMGRATAEILAARDADVVIADINTGSGTRIAEAIGPSAFFERTAPRIGGLEDGGEVGPHGPAEADRGSRPPYP